MSYPRQCLVLSLFAVAASLVTAFVPVANTAPRFLAGTAAAPRSIVNNRHVNHRHGMFNKMFEESGPLGKGITVGKVQVALVSSDRSLFKLLEKKAGSPGTSSMELSKLANEVCLTLLRKSDDWTGACSESQWYSQNDSGKAESQFNDWSNREASKFEKVRMLNAVGCGLEIGRC